MTGRPCSQHNNKLGAKYEAKALDPADSPPAPCATHRNTHGKSKMSAECAANALALLQAHAEAASLKSSAFARHDQPPSGFEQHAKPARLQSTVDSTGTQNEAIGGFIQHQMAARSSLCLQRTVSDRRGPASIGTYAASTRLVKLGAADARTHDDVLAQSRLAMALRPRQRGGNKLQSQY